VNATVAACLSLLPLATAGSPANTASGKVAYASQRHPHLWLFVTSIDLIRRDMDKGSLGGLSYCWSKSKSVRRACYCTVRNTKGSRLDR